MSYDIGISGMQLSGFSNLGAGGFGADSSASRRVGFEGGAQQAAFGGSQTAVRPAGQENLVSASHFVRTSSDTLDGTLQDKIKLFNRLDVYRNMLDKYQKPGDVAQADGQGQPLADQNQAAVEGHLNQGNGQVAMENTTRVAYEKVAGPLKSDAEEDQMGKLLEAVETGAMNKENFVYLSNFLKENKSMREAISKDGSSSGISSLARREGQFYEMLSRYSYRDIGKDKPTDDVQPHQAETIFDVVSTGKMNRSDATSVLLGKKLSES